MFPTYEAFMQLIDDHLCDLEGGENGKTWHSYQIEKLDLDILDDVDFYVSHVVDILSMVNNSVR